MYLYLQSNPLMRNRPATTLPITSITTVLLICSIGFGLPIEKLEESRLESKGEAMGLSNSSKQAFVSADNVIVGKT